MARGVTKHTLSFPMTDAPGYLSHFEISLEGDRLLIQSVNKRGYVQAETKMSGREFFESLDRINPERD